MSKNIEMNYLTSSGYDVLYPKIDLSNVIGVLPVANGGTGNTNLKFTGMWEQLYVGAVIGGVQVFSLTDYNIFMGLCWHYSNSGVRLGCNESGQGGVLIGNSQHDNQGGIYIEVFNRDAYFGSSYWLYTGVQERNYWQKDSNTAYIKSDYIYSSGNAGLWLYGAKVIF